MTAVLQLAFPWGTDIEHSLDAGLLSASPAGAAVTYRLYQRRDRLSLALRCSDAEPDAPSRTACLSIELAPPLSVTLSVSRSADRQRIRHRHWDLTSSVTAGVVGELRSWILRVLSKDLIDAPATTRRIDQLLRVFASLCVSALDAKRLALATRAPPRHRIEVYNVLA